MKPTREELGLEPVGTTYTFEAFANPEEGDEVYVSLPPHLSHLLGERLRVQVTVMEQPEEKRTTLTAEHVENLERRARLAEAQLAIANNALTLILIGAERDPRAKAAEALKKVISEAMPKEDPPSDLSPAEEADPFF